MRQYTTLAHEIMHYIKKKRKALDSYLAVKIDISKAYDRVSWRFLRMVLQKMGFAQQWVDRVMTCVETISYRV